MEPADTSDGPTGGTVPARWVRTYVLVPVVASGAAVVLASIDPTRVSLGPGRYAAVLSVVAGLGLVAWTVSTFVRAGETLSPVVEPGRLVTAGPLALTRNPLYLGVLAAVAGVAVLSGSPVVGCYACLLAAAYHGIVVRIEEPELERTFGDAYRDYRARVPRWVSRRD